MSFVTNFIAGAKIIFARMTTKIFWNNFIKVAIPFFILVIVTSLLIESWRDIFAGDFAAVHAVNFSEGKWIPFFGYKLLFCSLYGFYITHKNMK